MGEDTEGPDVGGGADPPAAFADLGPEQFGRGVVGGGEGGGVRVGAFQFGGHVEVGEPGRTVPHQQYVGRFQVSVHPPGVMQLGQALAHLGDQRGPGGRSGRRGQQGGQGALRLLQYEDGRAVERGAGRVVDDEGLVHPHQPGPSQPTVQLDLPLDEFAQVGQLARGARTGGQELQGGRARQTGVAVTGPAGLVHAAEGARRDRRPHLPDADPVALRHGDGVRLGHRVARRGGAARTTRSSSRTRSKRSAMDTRDSFLPLSRGPASAVSGPGFSRSFTAR